MYLNQFSSKQAKPLVLFSFSSNLHNSVDFCFYAIKKHKHYFISVFTFNGDVIKWTPSLHYFVNE